MRRLMTRHVIPRSKWVLLVIPLALIGLITLGVTFMINATNATDEFNKKKILLIGASVGKEWELPQFPARVKLNGYEFESIAAYQYDKTEALQEVLMRPKRKFRLTQSYLTGFFKPAPQLPIVIILKECAAYFPGDMGSYQSLVKGWVGQIRGAQIGVVLSTVVPVTKNHASEHPGRLEQILAYNGWVREYARQERIPLLDLEAAVRTNDTERLLDDAFTSGDGLHLNKAAYARLDQLLKSVLEQDRDLNRA